MFNTDKDIPKIRVTVPTKRETQTISHTVDINQARWMVQDLTEKIKEHEDDGLLSRLMNALGFKGEK